MLAALPHETPHRPASPAYHPLVIVLGAVAAGIVADRYLPMPAWGWAGIAVAALGAWLLAWRKERLPIAMVALLLAAGATAAAWHHCRWYLFPEDDLSNFAHAQHQPVAIEAIALKTPRPVPPLEYNPLRLVQKGDQVRLDVEVVAIRDGADWRPASGRARMMVDALLPELQAGDRFRAFAKLSLPSPPMNPGELDMAAQARANRTLSELHVQYARQISLVATGNPCDPRRLLDATRMHGNRVFARYLGPRHSALAGAVLLGIREQLDPEETDAFQQTGTVHLLI